MEELPRYYKVLFNAVTDALKEMENGEYFKAQMILMNGQNSAEELYLRETEEE